MNYYPPVSFHFLVQFGFRVPILGILDANFQEVSGLNFQMETDTVTEGGENGFTHRLPKRKSFSNLVLKRGMLLHSPLVEWIQRALEDYDIVPVDVSVFLLNPSSIPIAKWDFIKAYPVKWDISNFNSTDNNIVTETLELSYQYFRRQF